LRYFAKRFMFNAIAKLQCARGLPCSWLNGQATGLSKTGPSMADSSGDGSYIQLTANIVSAYVSNNPVPSGELPNLISQVYSALVRVSGGQAALAAEPLKPAVSVKRSITAEYIVCLEDGKKFKSLKRHLRTQYGMTPEKYREKWGLPADYPMVAPNYAAARSQLAKKMGLGQQRGGGR
jgi:predicted transcriptional regulator